jgi:hypothetical protein
VTGCARVELGDRGERRVEAAAAVAALGERPVAGVAAVLIARRRVDRAVGELDEAQLLGLHRQVRARVVRTQSPGRAAVVAVGEMGALERATVALVIAADHEPAGVRPPLELDAVARPGGVPGVPLREPQLDREPARWRPRRPMVVAVLDERMSLCVVVPGVERRHQQHPPGAAIHDRRRVAARVAHALQHRLDRSPGPPAVVGAPEHDVDVPVVAAVGHASLGEREQRAVGRLDDRRDPVARVAAGSGPEEHLLVEPLSGSARRRQERQHDDEGCGEPYRTSGMAAQRACHRLLP